ncbi:hypothetical protein AB0G04_10665 [Actinoplanes sp. NPDC023801]|uniref:hypothetical protein n=1 Tax=Actinoplanes sp. NPDC023801 TaxID=3154595 RepID=UPI0033FC43F0
MKIVKVAVTAVLAVVATVWVAFTLLLGGYIGPGNAAEEAIERTAADIAHDVDAALVNESPGAFSTTGVSALQSAIRSSSGTVLGSDGFYSVELNRLQGWVDARFTAGAQGGLMGKDQESATVCLRFEVRWTYGKYVTYDDIDCP